MMTTAYNELYLDDAMQNLGDLVDFAVCDLGYDADTFWDWFIASGIASRFEKGNPKYVAGMSGYELAEAVLREINVAHTRKEPSYRADKGRAYWAGWVLAYYQWKTNQRFEDIVKNGLPLSTVLSLYVLHEADVSKFVEIADEILARGKKFKQSRLHDIRKARGFTQAELSRASGVSLRMVQLYEQRQNDISKAQVNVVLSLAKCLGCEVEDLIE